MSTDDVASSRMRIRGSASRARATAVAEPDPSEADMPLDPRQVTCAAAIDDLRLLVEDVHDLVQRRHGREERVVQLGELLDRIEEVGEVEQEGKEGADADLALE